MTRAILAAACSAALAAGAAADPAAFDRWNETARYEFEYRAWCCAALRPASRSTTSSIPTPRVGGSPVAQVEAAYSFRRVQPPTAQH